MIYGINRDAKSWSLTCIIIKSVTRLTLATIGVHIVCTIFIQDGRIDAFTFLQDVIRDACKALSILSVIGGTQNRHNTTLSIFRIVPIHTLHASVVSNSKTVGNRNRIPHYTLTFLLQHVPAVTCQTPSIRHLVCLAIGIHLLTNPIFTYEEPIKAFLTLHVPCCQAIGIWFRGWLLAVLPLSFLLQNTIPSL